LRRGLKRRSALCGRVLRRAALRGDAAGAVKAALPVAHAHAFHAHFSAGLGGVDEFAVADINADMAESAAHGVEKHQVAGLQVVFVDALGGGSLLFGAARQQEADALLVNGADKAAAVKTGFGGVAAALVGHAQETHGVDDQLGSLVADVLANMVNFGQQALVGQQFVHVVAELPGAACTPAASQAAEAMMSAGAIFRMAPRILDRSVLRQPQVGS
jgi:hypothetical protein